MQPGYESCPKLGEALARSWDGGFSLGFLEGELGKAEGPQGTKVGPPASSGYWKGVPVWAPPEF